jgi:hypothetical protein
MAAAMIIDWPLLAAAFRGAMDGAPLHAARQQRKEDEEDENDSTAP